MKKYLLFDANSIDSWCRIVTAENETEAVADILANEKHCFGWSVGDFVDGISFIDMATDIIGQILDSRDFNCYIFAIIDEAHVEVL